MSGFRFRCLECSSLSKHTGEWNAASPIVQVRIIHLSDWNQQYINMSVVRAKHLLSVTHLSVIHLSDWYQIDSFVYKLCSLFLSESSKDTSIESVLCSDCFIACYPHEMSVSISENEIETARMVNIHHIKDSSCSKQFVCDVPSIRSSNNYNYQPLSKFRLAPYNDSLNQWRQSRDRFYWKARRRALCISQSKANA